MAMVKIRKREAIPEAANRSAKARVRGIAARRKLMEADGRSLSAEEAAGKLGISKAAILKLYHKGQIIAWNDGWTSAAHFPVWQFKDRELLDGLEETLKNLSAGCRLDDFGRMLFLLSNQRFLEGKRPLDCSRAGEVSKVLQATDARSKLLRLKKLRKTLPTVPCKTSVRCKFLCLCGLYPCSSAVPYQTTSPPALGD
jgi:hypothetical protein